jgi:hypothetical protein
VHATSCVGSAVRLRRDSKAVMQRPAKPFRPVRLRLAPPAVKEEKPRFVGAFLLSASIFASDSIIEMRFSIVVEGCL